MKTDFTYDMTQLRRATRYRTARLAAINPLLHLPGLPEGRRLAAALAKLVNLWRLRVEQLARAGYSQLLEAIRVQFARNCPPPGVYHPPDMVFRPCHLIRVCPFCYAREVVMAGFTRLEQLLFGSTDPTGDDGYMKEPPPGVHLVAFRTTHVFGLPEDGSAQWDRDFLEEAAGRWQVSNGTWVDGLARRRLKQHRKLEIDFHEYDAAWVAQRFDFPKVGEKIHLVRGGLALTRRPASVEAHKAYVRERTKVSGVDVKVFEYPTKTNLMKGFLFALPYPAGMMHRSVDDVVPFLEGMRQKAGTPGSSLRASAGYGPRTQKAFFTLIGADTSRCD